MLLSSAPAGHENEIGSLLMPITTTEVLTIAEPFTLISCIDQGAVQAAIRL